MVGVAVRQNDRRDRLIRQCADVVHDLLAPIGRCLSVDDHDAVLTDDDARTAAVALRDVDVVFDLLDRQRLVGGLSQGQRSEAGQCGNDREPETGISNRCQTASNHRRRRTASQVLQCPKTPALNWIEAAGVKT